MEMPANNRQVSPALPATSETIGWYVVFVLCLSLFLSFTDRLIINLVVDPIRADLSLTDVQISLLQGVGFALIFAIATLPCGRLADSVNRRNLIAVGMVLWSAATIACGFATDFVSFFAARVVVGLGEAALVPAAASLIIDCFPPRRRGTALGVFTLGAVLGTGVALFVGSVLLELIEAGQFKFIALIRELAPWRQLMVLAGVPGFVLLSLLLLIHEPMRQHSTGLLPVSEVIRQLLANNGTVLRVCMVKAALAIGDYGLIAWMPTLLQRNYGLSPLAVGGALALAVSLSGAMASVVGGTLSDWFVRRHGVQSRVVLLLGCYAVTVAGGLAVLLAASNQQVTAALALWVLGSVAGYVIGHIVMQECVPNEMRATTISISVSMTALIGIGMGPTLVALVAEHGVGGEKALQPAMGMVSLCAALLAFIVIWPPIRNGIAEMKTQNAARPSIPNAER